LVVHIVPIPSLEFEEVYYYSVRLEGKDISEYKDFQQRHTNPKDRIELAELNRFIQQIGNSGAHANHFRNEGAAEGLPPPYHFIETDDPNDYGLRLYCIRLSPSVVILLNGGRKTAQKAHECNNCKPHFMIAQRIAKKITEAIQEGFMELNEEEKSIDIEQDFELEI